MSCEEPVKNDNFGPGHDATSDSVDCNCESRDQTGTEWSNNICDSSSVCGTSDQDSRVGAVVSQRCKVLIATCEAGGDRNNSGAVHAIKFTCGMASGTDTEMMDCHLDCGHTANAGPETTESMVDVEFYDVEVYPRGTLDTHVEKGAFSECTYYTGRVDAVGKIFPCQDKKSQVKSSRSTKKHFHTVYNVVPEDLRPMSYSEGHVEVCCVGKTAFADI